MSIPKTRVSSGTRTTPPPSPVSEPRNPAPREPAPMSRTNSTSVISPSMGLEGRRQQGVHSHPVLTVLSCGDAIDDSRRPSGEPLEAHPPRHRSLERVAPGLPPGRPARSRAWRRADRRACGLHDLGVRGQCHRIPRLLRGIRGRRPARGRADRRRAGRERAAARGPGQRPRGSGGPWTRDSAMGGFAAGGRHRDGGQPPPRAPAAPVREHAGCRHPARPVPGADDRSRTACAPPAGRPFGWSGCLTRGGAADAPDDVPLGYGPCAGRGDRRPPRADAAGLLQALAGQVVPFLAQPPERGRLPCRLSVAVSLGDPVGPLDELELTIRSFLGLCADNGWTAAFHQVLPDFLPVYRRLGLHVLKIGEEALVDLERFATRTSQQRSFRRPRRRLGAWGYRVTREPGPHSEPVLDEVEEVSREWLSLPGRRERAFALGRFDRGYLARQPLVVARDPAGRLVAFANQVPDVRPGVATVDLMRHRRDAPNGLMDYLFGELMLLMRREGYRWFSLGLAPLAGLAGKPGAGLEERAVHAVY